MADMMEERLLGNGPQQTSATCAEVQNVELVDSSVQPLPQTLLPPPAVVPPTAAVPPVAAVPPEFDLPPLPVPPLAALDAPPVPALAPPVLGQ